MAGKDSYPRVSYASAVFGDEERAAVASVLQTPQIVAGKKAAEFEEKISSLFGKKFGLFVNSGSSANLLAFEALQLPKGSEVITPVLTFSTTVAPLIKCGLVPVFVDVMPGTYVVDVDQVEKMITKKTSALMIPSLLGNIPDFKRLQKIAKKHKLILIEDSCDTLGPRLAGMPTGFYTHISTTSFYASHIITAAGEGGMACFKDKKLYDRARILAGWGRRSALNESEDVHVRYKSRIAGMPYDAKFIFEDIGYNMRTTDISAAFGLAQLGHLSTFATTRRKNFAALAALFKKYEQYFILPVQCDDVETSWLAFPITIKKGASFSRMQFVTFFEEHNIQTRPVFTGNILKHPGFKSIKHRAIRVGFPNAELVMKNGFLIGCHHGMRDEHLAHIEKTLEQFMSTLPK